MDWRITDKWLKQRGAPRDQIERFARLYPQGCPINLEAALTCEAHKVDMVWVGCQLMTPERRGQFMFFTLEQRLAPLAELFRMAGLRAEAKRVQRIQWGEPKKSSRLVLAIYDAAVAVAEAEGDTHVGSIAQIAAHLVAVAGRDAQMTVAHVLACASARRAADDAVRAAGLLPPELVPGDYMQAADFVIHAGLNAVEVGMALPYVADATTADLFGSACAALPLHVSEAAYLLAWAELADAASKEVRAAVLAAVVKTRHGQIRWIWGVLAADY